MPIELLPADLSPAAAAFLLLASFFTSAMSGAFGIGGGVLLLALMTPFMPVAVLIPVHGVVQIGSNAGRAIILLKHAVPRLLLAFAAGAAAGAVAGGLLVTDLPEAALRIAIGLFVMWSAVGRLPAIGRGSAGVVAAGGFGSTLLTMFVGATGPFVMALLRQADLQRQALVATHSAAMTLQHGLKVVTFGLLGFAFGSWLPLMVAMIATGFAGTVVGTRFLKAMPERRFRRVLGGIMLALGAAIVIGEIVDLVTS